MDGKGKTRIERDSLGDVEVPADALYGAQTERALRNFPVSGILPWRAFVWSMATIKKAAAEVNGELGLLDRDRSDAIARAVHSLVGCPPGRPAYESPTGAGLVAGSDRVGARGIVGKPPLYRLFSSILARQEQTHTREAHRQ